MTDLRYYFDGTNGKPFSGEVSADYLISAAAKFNTVASARFSYSDEFFSRSACSYDHRLALASLCMSLSAFFKKGHGDKHIRSLLYAIGCDERSVRTAKFGQTNATDDSCGYALAAKRLPDGTHLIPVVIRSHRYGGEWVSNARVADEACPDHAAGFKVSADRLYDAVTDYIEHHGFNRKKTKLWVCGFSRGAAAANLLGARLNLESGIPKDNVFVYTFATPRTVYDRAAVYMDNIFNVVSELDAVPRVPIASWGFTRYGTDLYLPCALRRGTEEFTRLKEKMQREFDAIMIQEELYDLHYEPLAEQELALDLLMDYLDDLLTSPEKYREGGYQQILMDYLQSRMTGTPFRLRPFVLFLLDGNAELADELCTLIEQWNGIGRLEKVQRITRLPAKRRQGEKTPAAEIVSMAIGIFVRYAAKLTATKVTGGEQDHYYEQLVEMIVDVYHNGVNSALLMQHWPETYLAWLRSGDERTLFRTTSYERKSIK